MSTLHLISPKLKTDRDGDVVFVHGLGGDPFDTWQPTKKAKDSFLHWLAEDLSDIGVWTLEYNASPSEWLGPSMPLIDRAKQVAHLLDVDKLGVRPIVFVGHSLGGLVIKQILRTSRTQGIDAWRNIVEHTQGIVFIATPHTGADLATWLDRLRVILRSGKAAEDLKAHNPVLRDLGQWYSNQSAGLGIETLCFYETQQTSGVLVVDPTSANPGISGVEPIPVDADHLTICKPRSRDDLVYKSVKRFIEDTLGLGSKKAKSTDTLGEASALARFFISYRRSARNDPVLAKLLADNIREAGHDVFINTEIPVGTEWAKEISARIEWCDFLVVLLSEDSIESEAVQSEVRLASQRRRRDGRPALLPIRVAYDGPLGYELETHLGHYHFIQWRTPADNAAVLNALHSVVQAPPKLVIERATAADNAPDQPSATSTATRPQPVADPRVLRPPGGTIRLEDPLYLRRHADDTVEGDAQITGETIVIKAPRQMGKSSLLMRYLAACRGAGKRFVYIDFQRFPDSVLDQYEEFLQALADQLVSKLELDVETPQFSPDACQLEFDRFVTKTLLGAYEEPMTLAFDEVDRLLGRSYQGSFFSLLRGWHNARAELSHTWEEVDLALVISTEPYLLIDTGDRSPFNVTPPIELQPFGRGMLNDLNERFGQPLTATELDELHELLGGQPYLTRLAFYRLRSTGIKFREMVECAAEVDGPFGDHMRALLMRLDQAGLRTAMRQAISGAKIDDVTYYRLHGAGLVRREDNRIRPANLLYARFFRTLQ